MTNKPLLPKDAPRPSWWNRLESWTPGLQVLGLILGLAALIIPYWLYFKHFGGPGGGDEARAAWGQLGDFVGGVVNPVLGFLTLTALAVTVAFQRQQLQNSRDELKESRAELARTSAAACRTAEVQRIVALCTFRELLWEQEERLKGQLRDQGHTVEMTRAAAEAIGSRARS